jgi:hypothetical protein
MAGGGTFRTTARVLPEAAALRRRPRTRKCRLQKSKRNFAEREALAGPDSVVTEGEHPPGGRSRHTAPPIPYSRELCRSLGRVRADPSVLGCWLITRSRRPAGGLPGQRVVIAGVGRGASSLRQGDVRTGQVAVRGSDRAVKAIRVRLAAMAMPSTQVRAGAASMTAVTAVASRARMTGLAAAVNLVRR